MRTQIWLIPSVSLKSEVESVSAVAVCSDRMHISIPGIVGLFWRLGLSDPLTCWRCQGFLQKCNVEDDTKLRGISNRLYHHSFECIFFCPLINSSKWSHYPAVVFHLVHIKQRLVLVFSCWHEAVHSFISKLVNYSLAENNYIWVALRSHLIICLEQKKAQSN